MYKNQCRHMQHLFGWFITESNAGIYGTSFWMIYYRIKCRDMGHLFGWFITESNAGIWDIFLDDLLLSPLPAWKLFHGRVPYISMNIHPRKEGFGVVLYLPCPSPLFLGMPLPWGFKVQLKLRKKKSTVVWNQNWADIVKRENFSKFRFGYLLSFWYQPCFWTQM